MRIISGSADNRDAESLFRSNPISEIRNVESTTNKQIQDKKEELRQLVGTRYRDLIDSADSILQMKSASESITSNISSIHNSIRSLSVTAFESPSPKRRTSPNSTDRFRVYGTACRVKYLVDTPENIWGCLDGSMFLEAAARYIRAKHVHSNLMSPNGDSDHNNILSNFPLLQHQWQIVESFKAQISQRSHERLLDRGLPLVSYADALAAVAITDDLDPEQVLRLFLEARKTWILHSLTASAGNGNDNANANANDAVSAFCDVLNIIQVTIAQVGELFLHVMNDMPLFYKVILGSPPASQLFGGIPNPDDEVRLWKSFRDKLESVTVILDKTYISTTCWSWLRDSGAQIVSKINGRYLVDAIPSGQDLRTAEKLIRLTMESKEVLQGSLEWLKSVFGSDVELPWNRIRELVLEGDLDLWNEIFEDAFVRRMKTIIDSGFEILTGAVNVSDMIHTIGVTSGEKKDPETKLTRPSIGGGVWFAEPNNFKKPGALLGNKAVHEEDNLQSCLNAYFGPEVSQIRDQVDSCCQSVLEDLLSFLESANASVRLKDLVPYLQNRCYESVSTIFRELKTELDILYKAIGSAQKESDSVPPPIIVERSIFIGRLLFAFENHSKHIPLILGSPRFWVQCTTPAGFEKLPSLWHSKSKAVNSSPFSDSLGRQILTSSPRQTSSATAALLGSNESTSPKLEDLCKLTRELCIRAYSLWISWLSDELSAILSRELEQDDGLSATAPLRGWEETIVKQEQSDEGSSEMKILLPSMPSLYVISFLCQACEEIHSIGGHVLDKSIVQRFALSLIEKVISVYESFLSSREASGVQVSEKGTLQVLLDIKFAADVLSGGDFNVNQELPKKSKSRSAFRKKHDQIQTKSAVRDDVDRLISSLSQKLDPIDWLTYEPYLWENERQSYLRHAVIFGFFVQLNRMYTDTVQKLPTNSESNIMRCSVVPRFKYLPISAPALSSRGNTGKPLTTASNDITSRSSWSAYTNGELSRTGDLDDHTSFGVATPFLKSFMQVGSRFGESTFKLGSILTDGQVGIFKDRSAAAMSTFGDILPVQAAGLLSSFTTTRSDS